MLRDREGFSLSTSYSDFVASGVFTTTVLGGGIVSVNTGGEFGDPYLSVSA